MTGVQTCALPIWLQVWSAALAAAAAAGMGFLLSPTLFHSSDGVSAPAVIASRTESAVDQAAGLDAPLLADARAVKDNAAESADYLLLHQRANPSLYGVSAPIRPAALSSHPSK